MNKTNIIAAFMDFSGQKNQANRQGNKIYYILNKLLFFAFAFFF